MAFQVKRFPDPEETYRFVQDSLLRSMDDAIQRSAVFRLALSGGTTPLPLFDRLLQGDENTGWKHTRIFWVDERWVEHSHPDSNFGMAWKRWLRNSTASLFPIQTELPTPDASVRHYQQTLCDEFGTEQAVFDWMILGAGTDGHTASIFNCSPEHSPDRYVIQTRHPQTDQVRISLTLPVITSARTLLMMIMGGAKKQLLADLLSGALNHTPAGYVLQHAKHVTIITDIN